MVPAFDWGWVDCYLKPVVGGGWLWRKLVAGEVIDLGHCSTVLAFEYNQCLGY